MKIQKMILFLLPLIWISCAATPNLSQGVELMTSRAPYDSKPQVSEDIVSKLTASNTQFTFDLYKKLAESDKNFVFSPYSISMVWAMVWEGAQGETADEIAKVLHFDTIEPIQVQQSFNKLNIDLKQRCRPGIIKINLDNSIWAQKNEPWREKYLDTIKRQYNRGIYGVDFRFDSTRDTINNWIYEKTEKHFKDALDPDLVNASTVMVLLNATLFAGQWENMFDPYRTKDSEFILLDGTTVSVQMMSQQQKIFKFYSDKEYAAIELPYKGNELSMLVIMPDLKIFRDFESQLNKDKIIEIDSKLSKGNINLSMPKFAFDNKARMKETFKSLGIKLAFDGADFSKMCEGGGLWVEDFVHGAYIKVDEKGTEALSFSFGGIVKCPSPEIVMNHPFIFLIRENSSGTILFAGRVMNPAGS